MNKINEVISIIIYTHKNKLPLDDTGVATGRSCCNEKGMRFESATVPAAVKPDHEYRDDGFMKNLPLSASRRMGRLHKTGISQKTCQGFSSMLSGRKATDLLMIPAFSDQQL